MANRATLPDNDPYRVLKLRRTCTLAEIKVARKRLELKFHPDKQEANASDDHIAKCAERLTAVREAFALIGTEEARAAFDEAWAEAHPSAADSASVDADDAEVMDPSEFCAILLHCLAIIFMTIMAWPVLEHLGRRHASPPIPMLAMLACLCLVLTVPCMRLPPALGLRLASLVYVVVAAARYSVQECGLTTALVLLLLWCYRARLVLSGARFTAAVLAPLAALLLWSLGSLEPVGWLLQTWATLGATYIVLTLPEECGTPARSFCATGAFVFAARLMTVPHSSFTLEQLQMGLGQCAVRGAIDALASEGHVAWLIALGVLYCLLVMLLASSSIPFEEIDAIPLAKPRIEVEVRIEVVDGSVSDLLDVVEDFEDIAEACSDATCQAYPETSVAESKCAAHIARPMCTIR